MFLFFTKFPFTFLSCCLFALLHIYKVTSNKASNFAFTGSFSHILRAENSLIFIRKTIQLEQK